MVRVLHRQIARTFGFILLLALALFIVKPFRDSTRISRIRPKLVDTGCRITSKGSLDVLLLKGNLLTHGGVVENGEVFIKSGRIAGVGRGLAVDGATVIDCIGSTISPGFINTHEHITYSTVNPLQKLNKKARHRHDWRVGARGNDVWDPDVNGTKGDAIKWGELRHILSGTTSIVGGGMVPGLTRNLDFASGLEDGLLAPPDIYDVFPLDDSSGILRHADCDYGPAAVDHGRAGKFHRYLVHVGEGMDDEAANEFRCLSSEAYDRIPLPGGGGLSTDIISPNLALIHALGLTPTDYDLIAQRGAHIIWSPRSNVFLYGNTLNITHLLELGINVALGTDWLPSGSATMAREAVCASSITKASYDYSLDPKTLWEMMTINAARAAGFEEHIGSLQVDMLADIAVFRTSDTRDPYAHAVFGPGRNIELVLRGGKTLLADSSLRYIARDSCESVRRPSYDKLLCVADELGSSFTNFEASLRGVYPALFPGNPPDEPSCEGSQN